MSRKQTMQNNGYATWFQICRALQENSSQWTEKWDDYGKLPYTYKGIFERKVYIYYTSSVDVCFTMFAGFFLKKEKQIKP